LTLNYDIVWKEKIRCKIEMMKKKILL
jgi:hypothetical protein